MKKLTVVALCLLMVAGLTVTYTVMANPGSDSDPVVSFSYLTQIFKPEVKSELSFKIVSLDAGKFLYGKEGTELILRMGEAIVYSTPAGGFADVTAGYDLPHTSLMPSNHLLIVPKDDGRCVWASSNCLIMVKGDYTIK